MKHLLALVIFGWGFAGRANETDESKTKFCPNRTVAIIVETKWVDQIAFGLRMRSNLPYLTKAIALRGGYSKVLVSYRRARQPEEVFPEPFSPELGHLVYKVFQNKMKQFGIKQFISKFNPDIDC